MSTETTARTWTTEERERAERQVRARENTHFSRNVRWDVRNDLQCELNEARRLLIEIQDGGQRTNKNHPVLCTSKSEVIADPEQRFHCDWCRRVDQWLKGNQEEEGGR